jgi:hypothetical protein
MLKLLRPPSTQQDQSPISAYWTASESPQKCINENLHLVISACIDTVTSFGVLLLSFAAVFILRIKRKEKIVLGGLYGVGFAACVAGILRIYLEHKSTISFDRTWFSSGLWISSSFQLYLGLVSRLAPKTIVNDWNYLRSAHHYPHASLSFLAIFQVYSEALPRQHHLLYTAFQFSSLHTSPLSHP